MTTPSGCRRSTASSLHRRYDQARWPHPYHGSEAQRRAIRRCRSSHDTVRGAVMGSVAVPETATAPAADRSQPLRVRSIGMDETSPDWSDCRMAWSWKEIEEDWLSSGQVAYEPERLVEAFDRVEEAYGRKWFDTIRYPQPGVEARGAGTVVSVVRHAQLLASLDGIPGSNSVIDKMKQGDRSAISEVMSVCLFRSCRPDCVVELYPEVRVGARKRKPDLRVQAGNHNDWTYVEVTAAESSAETAELHEMHTRISSVLKSIKASFALEVFLRRPPTEGELEVLIERVEDVCHMEGKHVEELPNDLGKLLLNYQVPGKVVLEDHGEPPRPALSTAHRTFGPDEPDRQIVVRIAYADDRAEKFLRTEAQQLPIDAPGLIMVNTAGASGAMKTWEPLLRRRLQPNLHTRVSGICLFQSATILADRVRWDMWTKMIRNPHAKLQLPQWITDCLLAREKHDPQLAE
jgi:hypothetical protein